MKRFCIQILTLCLVTAAAMAEDSLTVEKAIALALERNHTVRGAARSVDAARWGKLNAYANFLPKAEIASSYTRVDDETYNRANASIDFIKAAAGTLGIPPAMLTNIKPFVYREQYATDITVVQPLYNGGAEIVGLKAANALFEKSSASYRETEQDVVTRVKDAYYGVLKAEEFAELAKESLDRTLRYLETTRRRVQLGSRTETDVLRWEVQRAADEGALITAQNYVAMARLQLNDLLGVEPSADHRLDRIPLTDSTFALPLNGDAGTGTVSPTLLLAHPTMQVMETNLRLADINVSKSWINFQPRVNLAFQYGWEKNSTAGLDGIRPWALSLQLSIPVFNSFGDYTALQKTKAEYESAEEQVRMYKAGLAMQATNARWMVAAARKKAEAAFRGLRVARDVLGALTRRYEMGGASGIDILDVTMAYTGARVNYIGAVYDYFTALAQLDRAMGTVRLVE